MSNGESKNICDDDDDDDDGHVAYSIVSVSI